MYRRPGHSRQLQSARAHTRMLRHTQLTHFPTSVLVASPHVSCQPVVYFYNVTHHSRLGDIFLTKVEFVVCLFDHLQTKQCMPETHVNGCKISSLVGGFGWLAGCFVG